MSALTSGVSAWPHWRLGVWSARAWRSLGWRQILLAPLIQIVRDAIHPLGGIYFGVDMPGLDHIQYFLTGHWLLSDLSILYGALVADEALDDGVPAVRAYGLAVIVLAVLVPIIDRAFFRFAPWLGRYPGQDEGIGQYLWWSLVVLYEVGFGLAIYGYWRVTQRAMRQAQAAETERVRNEQRVQTARLLALQARVEPQLLFDALAQVGILHERDPRAADALLADLIALLRSMQPDGRLDNSIVEQEFGLVEAWLRVTRSAGRDDALVRLNKTPDSERVGIAPMLVLPLLRATLAAPHAMEDEWVLSARVIGQRLRVTLQSNAADHTEAPDVLAEADLTPLHERLARLYGRDAELAISPRPPSLTLDLPLLPRDSDDQSAHL
jgi:hypothetical protein